MQMELLCPSKSWSSEGATESSSEQPLDKPLGYIKAKSCPPQQT